MATPPAYQHAPILEFFEFKHLPEHLREVSQPIGELAEKLSCEFLEELRDYDSSEAREGLRKLLEAKDCFVRARVRMVKRRRSPLHSK